MRRIASSVLVLFVALICGFSLSQAQQGAVKEIDVSVSFDFNVGDKSFAPGEYRVTHRSAGSRVLTIRRADGGDKASVRIIKRIERSDDSGSRQSNANLVFAEVEGRRVLSEVWIPGVNGFSVRKDAKTRSTRGSKR